MSQFLDNLKSNLEDRNIEIVFPEGTDPRVLTAAVELAETTYVKPIVLGTPQREGDFGTGARNTE